MIIGDMETYELIEQLRKDMNEAGDTPLGRALMAVVMLSERLDAMEKRHQEEDWQDMGSDL